MSQKTTKIISWVCVVLSVLLILFGCFAPSLLTGNSQSSRFDFTETGQIGDTIGGTMGPFVAIAGVLMTFIAFLMQVRANELQRDQLKKSFNLSLLEKKIESRNALELLNIDIKIMLLSVENTCKEIDTFVGATLMRPTGDSTFHFLPKYSRERYRSIDRNLLFNAFKDFMEEGDSEKMFSKVYNILDFYSEGIKAIQDDVYIPFTTDMMKIKESIPSAYEKMIDAINKNSQQISYSKLFLQFNNEIQKLSREGVLDVFELSRLVNDVNFNSIYRIIPNEYSEIVSKTNALVTQNNMLVSELVEVGNKFKGAEVFDWLRETSGKIDIALKLHTIESIQKDFEGRIS